MTTAVVAPPVSSALAPPTVIEPASAAAVVAARSYASIAPAGVTLASMTAGIGSPAAGRSSANHSSSSSHSPPNLGESRLRRTESDDNKRSPNSSRTPHVPKVIVKKEPTSPTLSNSRHRPRRLDLSNHTVGTGGPSALSGRPSAPLTSKESAGGSAGTALAMQDVGLACLSPGFNTHDPTMQQQLQRSMSVRDQQRLIIEARQKGVKGPGDTDSGPVPQTARLPPSSDGPLFRPTKMPNTSKRKGPPPALSIAPPNHELFANERVVQSAPLGQSFTGLRPHGAGAPLAPHGSISHSRKGRQPAAHAVAAPPPPTSTAASSAHIQHLPANQTTNRLPPISDVLSENILQHSSSSAGPRTAHAFAPTTHSPGTSSHGNNQPPLPSPGYPPAFQAQQLQQRRREFKSAEEAMQTMTGGREDLLPRVVHYGGHQPPTPPTPPPGQQHGAKGVGLGLSSSAAAESHRRVGNVSAGRRRDREEYERDNGSPLGGRSGGPRRFWAEETEEQRRKKEEFMSLCSKAWDLFHS